jgi:leader peptidase (prepilin peptidase)/N-methyltransferase
MMIDSFMFFLGAIVGSFLNVCIVRWPIEKSVIAPRSHCCKCKKPIPWYDNIPLLSYFLLRGKCRFCSERISPRYWFVELLTAVIFVVFYRQFGLDIRLLPYLVMVCGFIIATFVDFEHRIIPDEVSVGGMCLGLVLSFFIPSLHGVKLDPQVSSVQYGGIIFISIISVLVAGGIIYFAALSLSFLFPKKMRDESDAFLWCLVALYLFVKFAVFGFIRSDYFAVQLMGSNSYIVVKMAGILMSLFNPEFSYPQAGVNFLPMFPQLQSFGLSFLGLVVGGGTIYLMGILGDLLFRKESMGGGDVKLMAMIGAFLGAKFAVLTFFIAPFFGAVFGIVEKIRTKDTAIAYGPFLSLAAIITLFWGEQIIHFIIYRFTLH